MAIKLTGFIFLFESSGIYCLITRHWTTWQGSRLLTGSSSCSVACVLSSRHLPSCLLSDMSSQGPTTVSLLAHAPLTPAPCVPSPLKSSHAAASLYRASAGSCALVTTEEKQSARSIFRPPCSVTSLVETQSSTRCISLPSS